MSWVREFFDEIYLETYKSFLTEERNKREAELIAKLLDLKRGEKVLDVACGHGRHSLLLAKMGYVVTGVDITPLFIEKAKKNAQSAGVDVEFIVGDARELNFVKEFDAAFMVFTSFGYYGLEDDFKILKSISKALKDNGRFLLDIWNPYRTFQKYAEASRNWWVANNILVIEETSYDYLTGFVNSLRKFFKKGVEIGERKFSVKVYMPWEIKNMMLKAGFQDVAFMGGLDGSKFEIGSRRMVILAKK